MSSSTANELSSSFSGEQIATLLRTSGPIVHCVQLHAKQPSTDTCTVDDQSKNDEHDRKPAALTSTPTTQTSSDDSNHNNNSSNDTHQKIEGDNQPQACTKRIILENQITQIMVDTTPKKSMVSQILGGPFTFLGQYESEGIVLMVRRQPDTTTEDDNNDDENDDTLKKEIDGLVLNPHQLQPPLHNAKVYGDILIMRVAPSSSEDDDDDDDDDDDNNNKDVNETSSTTTKKKEEEKPIELLSNEEFFQNYTKDAYIRFASRTDIVPLPPSLNDDANEAEDEEIEEGDDNDNDDDDEGDDDEEDEEYVYGDGSDEEDFENDEEAQIGMMNLLLAQIIKKFREENGRGPNTEELLAIKSEVGKQLGIDESILGGASTIDDNDDNDRNDDDDNEEEGDENDQNHDDDGTVEMKKISTTDEKSSTTTTTTTTNEQNGNALSKHGDTINSNNKTETKKGTFASSKKRKSDESDANTKAKKVKFTNKDHIKLIPAIVKKDNDDDYDDYDDENVDTVYEEEGDMMMGIRRGENVEEGVLEEGEEEI